MRGSSPQLKVRRVAAAATLAVVLPLTAAGAAYSAPGDPPNPPFFLRTAETPGAPLSTRIYKHGMREASTLIVRPPYPCAFIAH